MAKKRAVITGITGQDGSYLAEFLLEKNYDVIGFSRKRFSKGDRSFKNIAHLVGQIQLEQIDYEDLEALTAKMGQISPDECYHLTAHSQVGNAAELDYQVMASNIGCTLNVFKALTAIGNGCKVFNASSGQIFHSEDRPVDETALLGPSSVYGVSKASCFLMSQYFKNTHGIHVSNGILFNHESSRRGDGFITAKLVREGLQLKKGERQSIEVGNIEVVRDWGHAKEFVPSFWKMLQLEKPSDYVLGTGIGHSVRDLIGIIFLQLGLAFEWTGNTTGVLATDLRKRPLIVQNEKFLRKNDPPIHVADISKARKELGHQPMISLEGIVSEMIQSIE